jgi:N-methylhydantoinase B
MSGALAGTTATGAKEVDPVTFEVLRNAFTSVVDEMTLVLERTSHSPVVSDGRDFSAALCDAEGRLVAEGHENLPAHVGTLPHTVKAVLSWLGRERLAPGDIILMNDSYLGGTHAQDVRTIMPVFAAGRLVAFVQNSAHWSDMGGPVPGSFHAMAASSYGEALCIPPVHIVREGELDDELMRFALRNVRVPELTQGDLFAQLAACRTGAERFGELVAEWGIETIEAQMRQLIRYSAELLRAELATLPDGEYRFEDAIDFDPLGDHEKRVWVRLKLTIEGERASFDLSDSDPQARGAINCTRSMAESAILVATKAIFPETPATEGIYEALEIVNPVGRVTHAEFPAPISGAFSTSYDTITACVFGCFLEIAPQRSMVCSANIVSAVVGGHDPRPGYDRDFIMYVWKEGGYGARPGKKDNHTAISLFASGTRNEPVEVQERLYPILTRRYELMQDSAGAGLHRGGLGVRRDFTLTDAGGTLSVLGSRGVAPVWGWEGGRAAVGAGLVYDRDGSAERSLGVMAAGVEVERGREIEFWVGGGGGWGDPRHRPVAWVLEDVRDEIVSLEAAREEYGVAIDLIDADAGEYRVDAGATERLRGRPLSAADLEPDETFAAEATAGPGPDQQLTKNQSRKE